MEYSYYPGCSLHATGIGYNKSMRAAFKALDANLVELDDWNCCGATAYMSVRETVACTVSARNLALAEEAGRDLVAPCSACFAVLNKTQTFMGKSPELRSNVDASLAEAGMRCNFKVPVRHPLEVLVKDYGSEGLKQAQVRSLNGIRVACYYGCQIIRPEMALEDDVEVPMSLDHLLEDLGAVAVPYPPKVRCCGGMLVATFEDVAVKLCKELVGWAQDENADCIVTTCPLCHANLEMLQDKFADSNGNGNSGDMKPIPIVYFTQLIGLALGCSEKEVGLQHNWMPLSFQFPRMSEARREATANV